ncbi:MAG: bifunctional riboflavin kinase/FAD synthetase [Oligoflexia bacterium]|nr:bifunctional riboflavin kinase/FAD synthetase [Oligoflexia bacterium]
MEVIRGIQSLARSLPHPVVTIGNFDGLHLGHRRIIELAQEKARQRGGTCVAFTLRPHPQMALHPERQLPLLSTYDEKLEQLEAMGVAVTVEEPFSREFSEVTPKEFFTDTLLRRLSAEVLVVGYDFAFGRERKGDLATFGELCAAAGIELVVVPPFRIDGEVVSSSRIRQHLVAGEVDTASKLLGREFFYRGVVRKGDGRGRTLGFPTANIKVEEKLLLPNGVYATVAFWGGKKFPSITNVGVRPTFHGAGEKELPLLVETHLLDVDPDLYGNVLEVRFVQRIRGEIRFPGANELRAQITADIQQARVVLSSASRP